MVMIFVVACGSADETNVDPTPATTPEQQTATPTPQQPDDVEQQQEESINEFEGVTLTFWYWDINAQEAYNNMFEEFYNRTGIIVEQSITPFADYWTNLQTALPAGGGPDIMWMNHPNAVSYIPTGLLVDITDWNLNMSGFVSSLYEPFSRAGSLFGVPVFFDAQALYYNKDIFDAAGMPYPPERGWSWDEMRETAIALTEKVGNEVMVYGLGFPFSTQSGTNNFIWGNGGDFFNSDRTLYEFNRPENIEALQFWHDLIWVDGISPNPTEFSEFNNLGQLFLNNMMAMEIMGMWRVAPYYEQLGDRLGIAHLPNNGTEANTFHNLAYVVNESTQNEGAVRKFMEFMTTSDAGDLLAPVFLPAHSDSQALHFEKYSDIAMHVFADVMQYARPLPIASLNAGPVFTFVNQEMLRVFMADEITAELLQSVDDAANEMIHQE